ncbi:MAG TPA: carboxypeptidase-like regulatory domain-containing protein, partial [Candidatus Acidoferrales bacterium]|nr:carboxypeptidase-like regulatory domain-containing protein [Candidatus Acidoferrales bacterium]
MRIAFAILIVFFTSYPRVLRAQSTNASTLPLECNQVEQDRMGTLSGTVSDISGKVISGALITASCGAFSRAVTTDSIGAYSLELSPGK